MSFTLNRDTTGVPVAGYDYTNDLIKMRILDQYGNPISSSNPLPVSLTGSNLPFALTTYQVVANLAIRDTASHFEQFTIPTEAQVPAGWKRAYVIYNDLDQAITLANLMHGLSVTGAGIAPAWNPSVFQLNKNGAPASIPSTDVYYVEDTEAPAINSPADIGSWSLQCTTAPTTGNVSIWLAYGK